MKHTPVLDTDQLDRLLELVGGYRDDVYNGEISGFDQSKDDELVDVDMLVSALRAAR
jgi:hypothetical protein